MILQFKGGREFSRFLQGLPKELSAKILESSVHAGARIIQQRAREKCPKPTDRRRPGTKRLADTIGARTVELDAAHAVVHVGSSAPYAHLVEFGHQIVARGPTRRRVSITRVSASGRVTRGRALEVDPLAPRHRPGAATGFVPPRPFLRPAFDESREQVIAKIADIMGRKIAVYARQHATTSQLAA